MRAWVEALERDTLNSLIRYKVSALGGAFPLLSSLSNWKWGAGGQATSALASCLPIFIFSGPLTHQSWPSGPLSAHQKSPT